MALGTPCPPLYVPSSGSVRLSVSVSWSLSLSARCHHLFLHVSVCLHLSFSFCPLSSEDEQPWVTTALPIPSPHLVSTPCSVSLVGPGCLVHLHQYEDTSAQAGLAGKAWKQVLLSLPRVFMSTPQVGDGGDGAMISGTNWPRHHTSLFLGAQSYSR